MAANGKKLFEALGATWTLAFDVNALCRIEDRLGIESAQDFQRTLQKSLSFRKLRTLFCCGLSPVATEDQAGEIMQELGMDAVIAMITETIQAAFPDPKGNARPNPPKPAGGTG